MGVKETIANSAQVTISTTINQLRALTQRSHQAYWHLSHSPYTIAELQAGVPWQDWTHAPLNDRQHIAWERGQQEIWLCQIIRIPFALNGFPLTGLSLRLGLTWWAELADIYVNGQLVQTGDLFDCFTRISLSDRISPGDSFWVALHLVSPGHDDGALVRSEAIYESTDPASPEPGFVADELAVLQAYAAHLAPEKLTIIEAAIAPLDWSQVSTQAAFYTELQALRQRLHPLSSWIKSRQIACVGHAHLDLAWLWPVAETWQAAERTFRSVLVLQADFPELTYTHSSPALFAWLEIHQPDLFQAIQQRVQAGTWAIDAGLWVEPETNTLSGESLARHLLYGQRYTRSRFGKVSEIAWLPDTFGFSWQLPQLLSLGGIQCFATQKLRWNEATQFPYALFWWEGLDGTHLLSLTLPPIGTDIDPVKMAGHGASWEAQTGCSEALWLPGMGDHGGGPTRDMLEKARRWAQSPFFPTLSFTSVAAYVDRISSSQTRQLPVWQDELYLELHRGCYTVHADQKWFNRRCEETLREAELFAAIAHTHHLMTYPRLPLTTAWQQVLFNQFHDILPGTSIPAVFTTVNADWQAAYDTARELRQATLAAIAASLSLPVPPHPQAQPLYLFNSLNWEQTALVAVALADLWAIAPTWRVVAPETNQDLPTQLSYTADQPDTPPCQPFPATSPHPYLLVQVTVPPLGYRILWLVPEQEVNPAAQDNPPNFDSSPYVLENAYLRVAIDPATGEVVELSTRSGAAIKGALRSPANQLQAFRDAGQYWDAWDIAPDYEQQPLPAPTLQSLVWVERGFLRQRLRVIRQVGQSTIQQDYVLDAHLPYLKVETIADWHENQVVLKAAFPLTTRADYATYEIPYGAIARPTESDDPHQQAKWEVPALRWADLSGDDYGLSILTDYKHGFDAKPDQLRLTLLKAPLWPDPQADRGRHAFTYALYPHTGDWRAARTPNWAIALGTGIRSWLGASSTTTDLAAPTQGVWLDLGSDRVHLTALKLSEDSDDLILRCGELYGQPTTLVLSASWERVNLLEEKMPGDDPNTLLPWAIATFKGHLDRDS
jgi:alpha-mannosidase